MKKALFDELVDSLEQAAAHARGETVPGLVVHVPSEIDVGADNGMDLSEFKIGGEFLCGPGRWRCTDIGTRVVVAIRVDEAQISSKEVGEPVVTRTLTGAEAEAIGWFDGPPYGVLEYVFDEDDRTVCRPA
ncbi:hypothetical protein HNR00_004029 [Methylorubrum rhodinum]|uniref:Uncharacterized protein n=1 Tax=Methylorubrum rhodinum TaxID=29428 RepID=A0A840ZR08_9HYPH|nr:hypothetical protein [Methylorubrum rhodinum]MBB5759297.1 hypothetical protein [Methylorubrum rhodinum]